MAHPSNTKAAQARVLSALRQEQAVQLRVAGATYRAIGQQLGISHAQAQRLVERALEESRARTALDVDRLREVEVRRMDALVVAMWNDKKDPGVASAIVRASARKAALLGLDAPLRVEQEANVTTRAEEQDDLSLLSTEELRAYHDLLAKVRGRPAASLPAGGAVVDAEPPDLGVQATQPEGEA